MSILKTIYLQHLNGGSPNATLDANGNMTVTGTVAGASSNMFRNRIHNGAMVIDQRNAGGSVSISSNDSSIFVTDRWQIIKNSTATVTSQQSSTAPTGFANSLLVNVTSGASVGSGNYFILGQRLEGFNFYDLLWGTSSAKTVTVSFWVRSSLTGTYTVVFVNPTNDREYITTYIINSANTWEYKTVTIPGDTSGTWVGATNGVALNLYFGLAYGTSFQGTSDSWAVQSSKFGTSSTQNTFLTSTNTFYITGVQLEAGTKATPFEFRQYGTELALCQRYYARLNASSVAGSSPYSCLGIGVSYNSTYVAGAFAKLPVTMRATPTINFSNMRAFDGGSGTITSFASNYSTPDYWAGDVNVSGGLTAGRACILQANNTASAYLDATSEL